MALAFGVQANADTYPSHPVRLVVPFAAGSATDLLGRVVAQGLSEKLGQQFVVDPRPGAGTAIGAQSVENSAPDGYTVLLGTNATFALNSILYKRLAYDPTGFKFVATTGGMPSFLMVAADSKYKTIAEFINGAKQKSEAVTYASSGVGSTGDMVGKVMANVTGTRMLHVPFKDGPQGLTAAMTGEVDGIFYTSIAAMPLIKAGKIRALVVSTDKRTPELPNVPTMAESGYPGFNISGWTVLAVPRGTPDDIVQKLRAAMLALYKSTAFTEKLQSLGMLSQQLTGSELDSFIAHERASMFELAKKSNIQPE